MLLTNTVEDAPTLIGELTVGPDGLIAHVELDTASLFDGSIQHV